MSDRHTKPVKAAQESGSHASVVLPGIIATGVVMAMLAYTRPIIVPFVIAVFFYMVLAPFVDLLCRRFRMPQPLAVIIATLVFLLLFGLLVFMVISSIGDFVAGADVYRERVIETVNWANDLLLRFEIDIKGQEIRDELKNLPILRMSRDLTGGVLSFLGNASMVILIVIFMLMGKSMSSKPSPLMQAITASVSRYISTKLLTSLMTGLLVWVVLSALGVELALMFAVLTVLLNFIPSIGSIIAVALPIPVLLLQFGLAWQFTAVLVLCGAIQFSIGNVLEPKLMGQALDIHPVTVIMSLLFWGLLWGVPGMVLGVPITVIVKIVLGGIESTKPIAEVLAGRIN